jgi:hypothetical protein
MDESAAPLLAVSQLEIAAESAHFARNGQIGNHPMARKEGGDICTNIRSDLYERYAHALAFPHCH